MAFPNKNQTWQPGQSGNPAGKPKGAKHLSTWIQELLNDEDFETEIQEGYKIVHFKGAPIKAIVKAQMIKAVNGDVKAFDVLGKYGFGTKQEIDVTSNGESVGTINPQVAASYAEFLKQKGK